MELKKSKKKKISNLVFCPFETLFNPNRMSDDVEDVYSDCYSTLSQCTSNTVNDIELMPWDFNWRNIVIIFSGTVGGLLFGYDTGVISGVLVSLQPQDLARDVLSDWDKGLITSMTSIGSFVGSILAFRLVDKYGRKPTLAICCIIFCIAAVWMAFSPTLVWLLNGRFIVGTAVGIAAQCIPIYLTEISPANIRGIILSFNTLAITGGQLLSYILAYYTININHVWRYLFGVSAIPAVLFILLLDFIPESPRWLLQQRKFHEAYRTINIIYPNATKYQCQKLLSKLLKDLNILYRYQDLPSIYKSNSSTSLKLYTGSSNISNGNPRMGNPVSIPTSNDNKITNNENNVLHNKNTDTRRKSLPLANSNLLTPLLCSPNHIKKPTRIHRIEPRAIRALFVGCTLMFFQQITGFNVFMYYSPLIFSNINKDNPMLPAIVVALTNFIFTIVAILFVDRIGKRAILLRTIWIMTFGLLLSTAGFSKNDNNLLIFSIIIFVGGYASGMGTIPWSSVEFLPLNRRSFGSSCISCTNWLTNAIVSMSYLSLMSRIGNEDTMFIFAVFTIVAWFFVYFCYPEVTGLSLEEIGKIYENGIDVHYVYRNYH